VSYLNSPRKGSPRSMKICVWTHRGLTKWKPTSNNFFKTKIGKSKKEKEKMEDVLKNKLFSIPLKFRGKPFLVLAQLSKIFSDNMNTHMIHPKF
jgi:hypothetical protein